MNLLKIVKILIYRNKINKMQFIFKLLTGSRLTPSMDRNHPLIPLIQNFGISIRYYFIGLLIIHIRPQNFKCFVSH